MCLLVSTEIGGINGDGDGAVLIQGDCDRVLVIGSRGVSPSSLIEVVGRRVVGILAGSSLIFPKSTLKCFKI